MNEDKLALNFNFDYTNQNSILDIYNKLHFMNKFLAMGIASRTLLFFSFVLFSAVSFSQKEYYNWSFGEGVGISFLTTPAALYTHNIGAGGATAQVYEAMASISDGAGNLRFSCNGLSVWQANGTIMSGGNNTIKGSNDGGGVSSAQGILVVGAPKNKDLYYIFTNDAGNVIGTNPLGFNYCTVDMTANGGLGQVSATTRLQTAASTNYNTTEMCAVVPATNGCDIWVLTRQAQSNKILAYTITPAGINPVPVESDFSGNAARIGLGNDVAYSNNDEGRGSLTFSNSGDKFVIVHHDQSWPYYDAIQLFDFNKVTGAATYSCEIGAQGWNSAVVGYDAVWSPDDSKIYVTFGSIWDIYQYDVTSWGNRAAIIATQSVVPGTSIGGGPIPTGQMLIGPDGVLYRSRKDIAYLATISGNLNGPVAGLTYNPTAYNLGTFCAACISDAALPNMSPILVFNATIDTTGINPLCNNKAPFNLTATPSGGTWSASCGACITNASTGAFNPALASIGNNSIYYTISACNADTVIVDVLACTSCKDTTLAASIPNVCSSSNTFNLNTYKVTSEAGTWTIVSGAGGANISGGNIFNINNSSNTTYTVRFNVTGQGFGCGNNPERTFTVMKPTVTLSLTDEAACVSESAFNVGGGAPLGGTYSGTGVGVSPSFNPAAAGVGAHTITYTYTDGNGCANTATDGMTVNALPVVALTLSDEAACVSGSAFNLGGGSPLGGTYSGTGVGVSPSFNPATAGLGAHTITYTYTDGSGCTNTATGGMTVNTLPAVALTLSDEVACVSEGAFNLGGGSPIGGTYSGTGVGVSPSFNPAAAGLGANTITYTYTDGNGCTNAATDGMTVNTLPSVTLTLSDDAACIDEEAFALSGGSPVGGTYSGTGVSGGNFDPANPGGTGGKTITYTYTDPSTGCTDFKTATLAVNALPSVTLADAKACPGGNIVLAPSPNVWSAYSWSTGSNNDTIHYNLQNTIVWVDVTDANGCVSRATANIGMGDTLHVDFGANKTICPSQSVTLNAAQFGPFQAPVTYDWDDLSGNNQPSARTLNQAGSYGVVVMDGMGCIGSDTVVLTLNTPVAVKLPDDVMVCFTGKETYTAKIPNIYASQMWSTGSVDTFALVTSVSEVIVTTTDLNNCLASDTMTVGDSCKPTILCLPNVITPNGDGLNDIFKPCNDPNIMDNILEINFQIFDRWGLKMFESSNVFPQWDGNFNGKKVADGVYYWIIMYTDSSDEKYELTGWVQVVD